MLSLVALVLLTGPLLAQAQGTYGNSAVGIYGGAPAPPPVPLFAPGPGPVGVSDLSSGGIESEGAGVPFVFPALAPGPAGGYGGADCICTAEYAPVCSPSGVQYPSPCLASCSGVFQFTVGPCASAMAGSGEAAQPRVCKQTKLAKSHQCLLSLSVDYFAVAVDKAPAFCLCSISHKSLMHHSTKYDVCMAGLSPCQLSYRCYPVNAPGMVLNKSMGNDIHLHMDSQVLSNMSSRLCLLRHICLLLQEHRLPDDTCVRPFPASQLQLQGQHSSNA